MTRRSLLDDVPAGAARGVGTGLVLMGFFTLLWGSWTSQGLGAVGALSVAVFTVVAGLFLLGGITLLVTLRRRPASHEPTDAAQSATIGRRFGLVVGAEAVAIFVASAGLGISGNDRYINPAIALVVGLHFLALVWVFPTQRAVNLATGSVLSLAAVAAILVLAADALGTDLTWSLVALVAASCTTAQGLTMLAARRRMLSPSPRSG